MAISASQIVNVYPRIVTTGSNDLEFSGLFLTKNKLAVYPRTLTFSSAKMVGQYFGMDSDEYKTAIQYFQGYDNSFKKPLRIHFSRLATEDIAAFLIGGQAGDVKDLKAVKTGTLSMTIDGKAVTANGLDLSTINTQSDAATIIQGKLTGTTVVYNSLLNAFIVTSATTGDKSSVSYATGTAADVLGLSQEKGAVISEGTKALDPSTLMETIVDKTENWVSFTTLTEADDDTVLGFAKWTSSKNCDYMYCPWTTKAVDVSTASGTNLPKKLKEANYDGVALSYGGLDVATLIMSIGACIDWDRQNGLVDWAFKSQDGMAASVTDNKIAYACEELRVNFYGKFATRNDQFIQLYEGSLVGGDHGYIDAYMGHLWLRNALQVSIMDGLKNTPRVPYLDEGYTFIRAWCMDPINKAMTNGIIQAGVSLSESQKSELFNEIGSDQSATLSTNGYYLQISDPGAKARGQRKSPILGLWYTYGGSVHKVDLPVTLVE